MEEFFDKWAKKFFKLTSKFDGLSAKIKEVTGININVGVIVLGILIFIFVFIFVKAILTLCLNFLYDGDYGEYAYLNINNIYQNIDCIIG